MDPYFLDHARTPYQDWVGSAAAEDSKLIAANNVLQLAGLDGDWTVLGIDLEGTSHGEIPSWDVRVYAYNRVKYGSLHDRADQHEPIPVKNVLLHDASLDDIVRAMHFVHFQLLKPSLPELKVVECGDHPPQD